jgi:hypothetical protein
MNTKIKKAVVFVKGKLLLQVIYKARNKKE